MDRKSERRANDLAPLGVFGGSFSTPLVSNARQSWRRRPPVFGPTGGPMTPADRRRRRVCSTCVTRTGGFVRHLDIGVTSGLQLAGRRQRVTPSKLGLYFVRIYPCDSCLSAPGLLDVGLAAAEEAPRGDDTARRLVTVEGPACRRTNRGCRTGSKMSPPPQPSPAVQPMDPGTSRQGGDTFRCRLC